MHKVGLNKHGQYRSNTTKPIKLKGTGKFSGLINGWKLEYSLKTNEIFLFYSNRLGLILSAF